MKLLAANNIDYDELTNFYDDLFAQKKFVADWHQIMFKSTETLQQQIQNLQNQDLRINNKVDLPSFVSRLNGVKVPKNIFDQQITRLVSSFKLFLWRCEAQLLLIEVSRKSNKVSQQKLRTLINQQSEHQSLEQQDLNLFKELKKIYDQFLGWLEIYKSLTGDSNKIISILNNYETNQKEFAQFESSLINLTEQCIFFFLSPNQLASNLNIDLSAQTNALSNIYVWCLWIQRAHKFLLLVATQQALIGLNNYGNSIKIPATLKIKQELENRIKVNEQIAKEIQEYSQNRELWVQNREREQSNLKTMKQYLNYIKQKPDAEYIKDTFKQAQQISSFRNNLIIVQQDMSSLVQLVNEYNNIIANQEETDPDQYILQLKQLMYFGCLNLYAQQKNVKMLSLSLRIGLYRLLQFNQITINQILKQTFLFQFLEVLIQHLNNCNKDQKNLKYQRSLVGKNGKQN